MTELMPMPEIERAGEGDDPIDEADWPRRHSWPATRDDARRLPLRPASVLPVGGR